MSTTNLNIPSRPPSNAASASRDLVGFSIEQDQWPDWAGSSSPNTFWINALNNLKTLSGLPTRIRIGANSEDHTDFSPAVKIVQTIFPAISTTVPYPEATNITVGQGFYDLAANLPSGTPVIWGVNFGENNLTAAYLETVAICNAFKSSTIKSKGVALEAIEIGNEADLYSNNGHRSSNYSINDYVPQWTTFAKNVTTTASKLMGRKVPLQGLAFAFSTRNANGFSAEAAIDLGILGSSAGKQIKQISQHHYSGSFCTGSAALLQDLMTKSAIRSNLTFFNSDIAAVQAVGLPYVLGETNSYSCHGAPGVSDTAGAALWALDYLLYATQIGIERVYFHEGIGYKYNFIQPVTLTRSIRDGTPLASPLPPHIQPAYYAAVIVAEAIGTSGRTSVAELNTGNATQVSAYAFYEGSALRRALFINLHAYAGGTRGFAHFSLNGTGQMTVKRLSVPLANATAGVTWGGQTYETSDAKVSGALKVQHVPVSGGVDVHDTEVVLLSFN
ncbi:hypothetical protein K488DRAFT_61654 [Vararia minispora EC-137]|uniref:Uncharacterized protein n=1 Tax=Vararia minispora EC-137 TaxID=1314806 RepID=A0ACB8Q6U5_9AGAM|nr:hypothetical protein K488DRAFT_61654 [Vararia minispora EC-137]